MLTYKRFDDLEVRDIQIQISLSVLIPENSHLAICFFSQKSDLMEECKAVRHWCTIEVEFVACFDAIVHSLL